MKIINPLTFAALVATLLFQTPIARADNNGAATVNFTKWAIGPSSLPGVLTDMAGIIRGGDVGDGTFTGEILLNEPTATRRHIVADYHLHGSNHSFTARVNVVQAGAGPGARAVITGVVTDGWLKDQAVNGEYTIIPPCGGTVNCIEVTLNIEPPPLVTTIRASQVEVCWNSTSNLTYQVQYSSSLTTNLWTSLAGCVLGNGSVKCITVPVVVGQPQQYYRVVQTNCVPSL